MNIVLIGMRGSGKSSVGQLLAMQYGKKFIEMDEEVVKKAGMSIVDIFAKHGPEYFRDRESEVVEEMIVGRDDLVVATGGGVVMREHNVELLKKNAVCIWLRASIDTLVDRTEHDADTSHHRPKLTDKSSAYEETATVLEQREPLYEKASDEVVDTENRTAEQVVDEIVQILQKKSIT